MDAAGKLYDILIFITVLFLVPSLWAVSAVHNLETEDAVRNADLYLANVIEAEGISEELLDRLNESVKTNAGLYYTVYVLRETVYDEAEGDGGSAVYSARNIITFNEIAEEIKVKGEFRLLPGDIITVKLFDRDSVLYTAVRRKRTY